MAQALGLDPGRAALFGQVTHLRRVGDDRQSDTHQAQGLEYRPLMMAASAMAGDPVCPGDRRRSRQATDRRRADSPPGTCDELAAVPGNLRIPRIWAELRLGMDIRVGRKRVARLMRQEGIEGVYRRRSQGCTRRNPSAIPDEDLVNRQFTVDGSGTGRWEDSQHRA